MQVRGSSSKSIPNLMRAASPPPRAIWPRGKMRHRVEKSAVGVLFLCTSVHMCLEVHFGVIPAINEIASIAAAACAGYKTKFISENTLRSITRWLWGFLSRASRLKTHSLAHLTDLSPAEIN
jgi:hypothetical protein